MLGERGDTHPDAVRLSNGATFLTRCLTFRKRHARLPVPDDCSEHRVEGL